MFYTNGIYLASLWFLGSEEVNSCLFATTFRDFPSCCGGPKDEIVNIFSASTTSSSKKIRLVIKLKII
jgi:hypothetical protein